MIKINDGNVENVQMTDIMNIMNITNITNITEKLYRGQNFNSQKAVKMLKHF